MHINPDLCIACEVCLPYCPVSAIESRGGSVTIDFDRCVECGTCRRHSDCPTDAFEESPEADVWPRLLRREFSDPGERHSTTKGFGRGTEEAKTNDVTGRVKRGRLGMAMEFGRPGISTRLSEMEKMTTALAAAGVHFEEKNPVTFLLADASTGTMREDVRNERVLSAILEVEFDQNRLADIVPIVESVAETLDTVFSWGLYMRLERDGTVPAPVLATLKRLGVAVRPNAKVNMGLGRPLVKD